MRHFALVALVDPQQVALSDDQYGGLLVALALIVALLAALLVSGWRR